MNAKNEQKDQNSYAFFEFVIMYFELGMVFQYFCKSESRIIITREQDINVIIQIFYYPLILGLHGCKSIL